MVIPLAFHQIDFDWEAKIKYHQTFLKQALVERGLFMLL